MAEDHSQHVIDYCAVSIMTDG